MRIDRLELRAVGPFTDAVLDFSQGGEGLHVVCGPNEAGKSSALRGLRYALFGFPSTCPDNFLHAYTNLRVGARLRRRDGESLEFVRRKAVKNALLAADNATAMKDNALAPFLGGFDADMYSRMFAIGHDELVAGGKRIASGEESVGQLLFAAGAGLADLRVVQRQLQIEAEELYLRKGKNPKVNQHLRQIEELRKKLREAQLPGEEWQRHDEARRAAVARRAELETELSTRQALVRRLERLQQAAPLAASRRQFQTRLGELRDAPRLSPGFTDRRFEAATQAALAEKERQAAEDELSRCHEALAAVDLPDTLVVLSDAVGRLSDDLGGHRKAQRDLPALAAQRDQLRRDARSLLAQVRPDTSLEEAEQLRLTVAQQSAIGRLRERREAVLGVRDNAEQEVAALADAVADLERRLDASPEPPDVRPLVEALRAAQAQGDLDAELRRAQAECETHEAALAAAAARLSGAAGVAPAHWAAVPLPADETVLRFESELAALAVRRDRAQTDLGEHRRQLDDLQRQAEELQLQGDVPSEESLQRARQRRDAGWEIVAAQWQGRGADPARLAEFLSHYASAPLAEAYRRAVAEADELADRLRRETARVERRAALIAQRNAADRACEATTAELAAVDDEIAQRQSQWVACFAAAGIVPRSPVEMKPWLSAVRQIVQLWDALTAARRQREALARRVSEHCSALAAALAAALALLECGDSSSLSATIEDIASHRRSPEKQKATSRGRPKSGDESPHSKTTPAYAASLGTWIARAEAALESAQAAAQSRRDLQREAAHKAELLSSGQRRLAAAREAAADWQNQWGVAMEPLGLPPETTPDCAKDVSDRIAVVLKKLEEAQGLDNRIEGIGRESDAFAAMVRQLAAEACPELAARPAEEAAAALLQRARQAQADRQKHGELQEQIARFRRKAGEAQAAEGRSQARLATLCAEAGCKEPGDLPRLEQAAAEAAALREKLAVVEEQLARLAPGTSLEAFIDEVQAEDADAIPGRRSALADEIRRLEAERDAVQHSLGVEEQTLRAMDDGQDAAAAAEEYQEALARLEADAAAYVRVQCARAILRESIERYRQKSEGPVLRRAGELFRRLTGGSFAELVVDVDDDGQSVLMGVRPDGNRRVALSGMSEGTADQLYLALRLASVEHALEGREPAPLVVDDILISFDDGRACAALEVLAELSRQTQVVFFTHHAHLADLARARLPEGVLFLHNLA